MANKKDRLIQRAQATARQPKPERIAEAETKGKGYRVIAVSLYTPEADWVDQILKLLKRAGHLKANRSLVVREAILRFQEELADKTPEEILHLFMAAQAKRTARQ